jgi:hypothetical protein
LPDTAPIKTSRGVVLLTTLLIAAAAVWSILANLPDRRLHDLGGLIRRAGDVTPERVFRLRATGYTLGVAFAVAAAVLWRSRARATTFLQEAGTERRGLADEIRRSWSSLAVANRAAFVLIFAIGVALRIYYLNTPMAYDEAYSFTNFARRPLVEALTDYNNTNNHLLNTLGMHVMYVAVGQIDWALRLPVFLAGVLLTALSFPWARARIGSAPALIVTALIAASPMMIDYSVNARGYTFLALFAVALDCCFLRIATAPEGAPRAATWIAASTLIWLGFFAMPTYLHPLAALLVWFVLEPHFAGRTISPRIASVVRMLFVSGLLVVTTYAPAFVFRGTMAFQNDFVQPLPFQQWANEFPSALWKGVERWIAGGVFPPFLLVLAWGGVVAWFRRSFDDRRIAGWGGFALLAAFIVPCMLMALQRVAPPPRLFFWQAPWFYLLVATGAAYAVGLAQRFKLKTSGDSIMRFVAYAIAAVGIWFAFEHPILREPHQRDFGIASVPDAVGRLKPFVGGASMRIYSPLPCDHPTIYYLSRFGIPAAVNGPPQNGERLYLLARPSDDPGSTLKDVVVKQERFADAIGPWNEVAKFSELTLWEASRPFKPPLQ